MSRAALQAEIREAEARLTALRRQARASTLPFGAPVVSQAEYGRRGAEVLRERYSAAERRQWSRMGGRPRNRSYEEIQATLGSR